jgi:hypothetical protein
MIFYTFQHNTKFYGKIKRGENGIVERWVVEKLL